MTLSLLSTGSEPHQGMIAGYLLRVEAADEQAERLARAVLTGFRLTAVQPDAQILSLGLLVVQRDDPSFDQSTGRLIRAAPDWSCYADEQRAWFVMEDAMIVIHRSSAQVEILLNPRRRRWYPELISQIFGCALHAILQPSGLHFLHGAGLIAPDSEAGVLIVGASGSGKSTLTLRLVMQGWRYLTDDLMLIGSASADAGEPVLAHAFRRNFAVSDATLAQCNWLNGLVFANDPPHSAQRKRWLDPDELWAGRYAPQCMPRVLVFPQLTNTPDSRLEALTLQEVLLSLCQETPLASYDPTITHNQMQAMTRLVQQTKAWRLHAGRDLLDVPDRAATLLANL